MTQETIAMTQKAVDRLGESSRATISLTSEDGRPFRHRASRKMGSIILGKVVTTPCHKHNADYSITFRRKAPTDG